MIIISFHSLVIEKKNTISFSEKRKIASGAPDERPAAWVGLRDLLAMPPVAAGDAAKWALLLRQLGTTSSMEEAVVFAVENPGKADEFVAAAVSWMRVRSCL